MFSIPTPSSDVTFYPFADGGVLFLKGSRRLLALNATAAWIWCLLGEVADLNEIADRLVSTFHVEKRRALHDASAVLRLFEREGLFSRESHVEDCENHDLWAITLTGPDLVEPDYWYFRRCFRVAGHLFEFCCQDVELSHTFGGLIDHLAVESEGRPADTRVAVAAATGSTNRWDLFIDQRGFAESLLANAVLPHLATLVFVRSCESLQEHLLFHAGVVGRNETTVIFPGEAGSGKTTLIAALVKEGCRFFSDELAVIHVEDGTVSPVPLPMSIKPGSVKTLERYYPGLEALPVHLRDDGKMVRYLAPPLNYFPTVIEGSATISGLVFPKYIKDAANRLITIDKRDALQRLAATGSSNRAFTGKDVICMIDLVERRPCYELLYQDLDEAVSQIKKKLFH